MNWKVGDLAIIDPYGHVAPHHQHLIGDICMLVRESDREGYEWVIDTVSGRKHIKERSLKPLDDGNEIRSWDECVVCRQTQIGFGSGRI